MSSSLIAHVEIPTTHLDSSSEFYKKVFNWEFKPFGKGYLLHNTHKGFTIGLKQAEKVNTGDTTIFHLRVENIEEKLKVTDEAGGRVYRGKTTIPAMGYYALIQDPEGNTIGLYQGN